MDQNLKKLYEIILDKNCYIMYHNITMDFKIDFRNGCIEEHSMTIHYRNGKELRVSFVVDATEGVLFVQDYNLKFDYHPSFAYNYFSME